MKMEKGSWEAETGYLHEFEISQIHVVSFRPARATE